MAEAQYQPTFEELEQIHGDIPVATPGPVAAKFDDSTAVGIDLPFVPDGQGHFKRNYSQITQARAHKSADTSTQPTAHTEIQAREKKTN